MENTDTDNQATGVHIDAPLNNEGVFAYIQRTDGAFTLTRYRQIIGAANAFKEGDAIQGIAADSDTTRNNARRLLTHTRIGDMTQTPLFHDDILVLIQQTTAPHADLESWTFGELKNFLLIESESRSPTDHPEDIVWQVFDAWAYTRSKMKSGFQIAAGAYSYMWALCQKRMQF
jgi:hypothetical protein